MITVKPTDTRFVDLRHEDWGLDWAIQLPEAASCAAGSVMTWPALHPEWKMEAKNAWHKTIDAFRETDRVQTKEAPVSSAEHVA